MPFTTLVVLDHNERGHFLKVTYPFDEAGLSNEQLMAEIKRYTPTAFHAVLPNTGIYSLRTGMKREVTGSIKPESLQQMIETWDGFADTQPLDILRSV